MKSLTTVHEFYKDRASPLGGPIHVTLHRDEDHVCRSDFRHLWSKGF